MEGCGHEHHEPAGEHRTRSRLWPDFGSGLLASSLLVVLACAILVPRYAELNPLGDAVGGTALALVIIGAGLCVPRRSRVVGAGVVAGAGLGLVLAWCALVVYVGLFLGV